MKPEQSYPAPAAKRSLVACLAALMALSWTPVWAQQVSDAANDDEIVRLSPFEVESDKDTGYLKTNAATATRIGMEIQNVPMNISVVSREFLDDTNARSLTDLFRYSATGAGDNRYAMRQPANEATPTGGFTMRGFTVNTLLRNGVFRYISYNLDNVDRVEIINGPASVFFGQGYPGGVINYITKQPSFVQIPTTFKYQLDDNSGQKFVLDHNVAFNKKAAFRIVGAWADLQGERRFEFRDNINVTPSLSLIPFDSGKLKITIEGEYLNERYNINDYDWIWGNAQDWKAYVDGGGTNSVNGYAAFVQTQRVATGDWTRPTHTSVQRGAYITDASGNRIHDEAFNYTSRGVYSNSLVKTVTATAELKPFDWLSARYNYSRMREAWTSIEGLTLPYGDLMHWQVNAAAARGYMRNTENHQLDIVLEKEFFGVKNKLLGGLNFNKFEQQYNAQNPNPNMFPFYGHVPGATNGIANPGWSQVPQNYTDSQVPVNQVIRDRNGNIKLVKDVYQKWDPGFEQNPSVATLYNGDRVLLDQYKPKTDAWYVNYQATLLDDRLTIMAGYRKEEKSEDGQFLIGNYPWFIPPANASDDTVATPPDVYGYDYNYNRTADYTAEGESDMIGASFAITPEISVYATLSHTFKFNTGNVGGFYPGDELNWAAAAIAHGGGSFTYRGTTITSPGQLTDVLRSIGAFDDIQNETGKNYEVGVKVSTEDSKYVGTLSIFKGTRANVKIDDGAKQLNTEEPLNYNPTDGSGLFPAGSTYNTRLLRWRTTNLENEIDGAQFELFYTPTRNMQVVVNGSWMWTAKVNYDLQRPAPGSAAYNAFDLTTDAGNIAKVASDIYYKSRLENVPEYRFNAFGNYTFTDGPVRGLRLGAGVRYSSETVISRTVDWNPLNGGLQAGDYLVFDATISYPWEIAGYKINTSLGIYNLTDEAYSEGNVTLSPARNFLLTNTLSF